jgi:Uma2 family endonuclease
MTSVTYPSETAVEQDTAVPEYPIYRFTVDQYHAMIDAGVLTEDDPIELLEGLLVNKMPKNAAHIYSTQIIRDILVRLLPPGWFVNTQDPFTAADSEPEPDAIVVRGYRRDFRARKAVPEEIALVIEVSDSTLRQDRTTKKRLYATWGIPVYWVINLVDMRVEVYSKPSGAGRQATYQEQQIYGMADEVPVVVDGRTLATIPVKEILP